MPPKYQVLFWSSQEGVKPVARWMLTLEQKDRVYIGGLLRDLANDGPFCRPKCFKHIEGPLWEIRDLRSPGPGYRVYFGFDGRIVCLVVNSGDKQSQARDIELAKKRLKMDGRGLK